MTKEKREKFQNLRDDESLSMTSGSHGIHFAEQHYQVSGPFVSLHQIHFQEA
ncbi:hypothetical protein [Nitrospira sp. Ecomares 2.1]